MITETKHWNWTRLAGWCISGAIASIQTPALAQLNLTPDTAPDRDLETRIERLTPTVDQVRGGTRQGQNVFHSFEEFNIPENRSLYFENLSGVRNILSRVTGSDPSDIEGTLGVGEPGNLGNANLYLINPNGIIFGPNARLDVNGSFVATTANAMELGRRGLFSASQPETSSLLNVTPTAFLFNQIANQPLNSITVNGELTVPTNQSILLVGGNPFPSDTASGRVLFNDGLLKAPAGRVDVAAVAEPGRVGLDIQSGLLFLRFPDSLARSPITLINGSEIDVREAPGGAIAIYAGDFNLLNTSFLQGGIAQNAGVVRGRAGDIVVNASGRVFLNQGSAIGNSILQGSTGWAGDIIVTANNLHLDGSAPNGGLTRIVSRLRPGSSANPAAEGRGGDILVSVSDRVLLTNGAAISTTTDGIGDAGDIQVRGDRIHFDGQTENFVFDPEVPEERFRSESAVFSAVRGQGDGGQVQLEARSIRFTNGGGVNTSTLGEGDAGSVTVIADDIVLQGVGADSQFRFSGIYSRAETNAEGGGGGGVIRIQTGSLSILEGATITAATLSEGDAGKLFVTADRFIRVSGVNADGSQSQLNFNTSTAGDAGELEINTPRLMVLDGANVSALTSGAGRGGILEVDASESIVVDGRGSRLSFDTLGSGDARGIRLETENLRVQNQGIVTVSNGQNGTGNPGNLTVFARTITLQDQGSLRTETRSGSGGNIDLNVEELTLLRNRSLISASASGFANGGNVTIETPNGFVLAVLSEDSDIVASADTGNGGAARARAAGVFGFRQFREQRTRESDFTASSVLGIDGTLDIDTEEREFEELEGTPVTAEIAQGCTARGSQTQSEFIVTGRGGLPSSSDEAIAPDAVQVDLVTRAVEEVNSAEGDRSNNSEENTEQDRNQIMLQTHAPVVEAQGWMLDANGEVVLTAAVPLTTSQNPWHPVGCHASQ
ncbi:S-layer family protein [Oculatella sp. FACHB-28]|uniref:two-partner secretion domain-containing protein n=1 Tax=Oculatella sp. FACHB-28 TaxID=2692845 RepID=UPI001686CAAF|nr:S-layer family protein [Oculatella sp. FACHB-28]